MCSLSVILCSVLSSLLNNILLTILYKSVTKKDICIFKVPEVPKKAVPEEKVPKPVPKRKEPLPPKGTLNIDKKED